MKFSERRTPGGYQVGEVTSAMQKAIRRGHEREALFWASELDLIGLGNYVWKRLRIIASEDVGLASTGTVIAVRCLYENWKEDYPKTKPGYEGFVRVFMFNAICLLCRAPKSRMLDHALMVMFAGERDSPKVPDHALDMHTQRGRQMGRGPGHFVQEASKLENEGDVDDPYRVEGVKRLLANTKWPRDKDDQQQLDTE